MQIDEKEIIEHCDEELALAYLLANRVCIMSRTEVSEDFGFKDGKKRYTTAVYVLVSDTFYYATADTELLDCNDDEEPSEIVDLYKLHKEKGWMGIVEWSCLKRKMKPLPSIKRNMIEFGYWTEELEKLEINPLEKEKM